MPDKILANDIKTSEKIIPKQEIYSYAKYDEFRDRFKTWEQLRAERYLC